MRINVTIGKIQIISLIMVTGCTSYLPGNKQPIAFAGYDQKTPVQEPVQLNGKSSFDPDGDSLSYRWSVQSKPKGASFDLTDADKPVASFKADTSGVYVVALVVSDGSSDSAPDFTNVTVQTGANRPPIADAGEDHAAGIGSKASLDGSGSTDPDNDTLTYKWSFSSLPRNSTLTASDIQPNNSTSAYKAMFTPDRDGEYVVRLEVDDGKGGKDMDTVKITVSEEANTPPVADAGAPFSAMVGHKAQLNGAGSYDPDGDTLTYSWSFSRVPDGSGLTDPDMGGRTTAGAYFTPDKEGDFVVRLTVSDGIDTDSDEVTIKAVPAGTNNPPVADAGMNRTVDKNKEVQLDGTGSIDPDGDTLTYNWSITQKPDGSLAANDWISPNNSTDASRPVFKPDRGGKYFIRLMVDDGKGGTDTDNMWVTAYNEPPKAHTGGPYSVLNKHEITLNGSATDKENDPLSYEWHFVKLPKGSALKNSDITDLDTLTPSFTPDKKGKFTLALVVTDWDRAHNTDMTDVDSLNNPPTAIAGGPSGGAPGVEIDLDGTNSNDLDEDALTYSWSFTSLPQGSNIADRDIQNRDHATASFVPDVEGTYEVQLTVTDTDNASNTDTLSIEVIQGLVIITSNTDLPQARECVEYTFDRLQAMSGTPPYAFSEVGNGLPASLRIGQDGIISGIPGQGTAGDHPFTVQVLDKANDTATRDLVLTVLADRPPVANAGSSVAGPNLSEIQLDGSASSDPDGNPIVFAWKFVSVPTGSSLTDSDINGATSPICSFVPNKKGDYVLELTVSDSCGGSSTDQVTATAMNNTPVASATYSPINPKQGDRIDLDGTGSNDPDSDAISYTWSLISVPGGSRLSSSDINNASSSQAWFTPDAGGIFTVRLTVDDGDGGTDHMDMDITVTAVPVLRITTRSSDIPDARECVAYAPFLLQAENGHPPYTWTEVNDNLGPVGLNLSGDGHLGGTPHKSTAGTVTFTAQVTDQDTDSAQKNLDVTILPNRNPAANAGPDTSGPNLSEISISGSASDPDGNPMAYQWSFTARPDGSFLSNNDIVARDTLNPKFTPDVKGVFILQLSVRDGCNGVDTDTVRVTSTNNPPIADAGPDQLVSATATLTPVQLDGTGSHDPDGDSLSYLWTLDGVEVSDVPRPTVRLPVGSWNIVLTVNDNDGGSDQDTINVQVTKADSQQLAAYVSKLPDSDDKNPCTREQNCATIGRGISRAAELTDTNGFITGVLVAEGEYHQSFQILAKSSLYCGYDPHSWVMDPDKHKVDIFTSDNNGIRVESGATREVEITGCIFHGRNAGDGNTSVNTLRIDNASPTFVGNAIILGEASYLRGLNISGSNSRPLVAWNTMIGGRVRNRDFKDDENGQAVLIRNSAVPMLRHNYIVGPNCDNGGQWRGHVHCDGLIVDGVAAAVVNQSVIIDSNYVVGGSKCGMPCTGLGLNGSYAEVTNNVIHGGFSSQTCSLGFLLPQNNENITPKVYHNTILGGVADGQNAVSRAVCLFPERDSNDAIGRIELVSNIIAYADYGVFEFGPRLEPSKCWNNDFDEDTVEVLYSDSYDTRRNNADRDLDWINSHFRRNDRQPDNISGDPDFIAPDILNPTNADWHISSKSACIDAGAPETVNNTNGVLQVKKDMDDEDRPSGDAPDIGADEQ
ncbi:MAG: hypothetical protein GXP49_06450 [Deltaproteobacteria bacterium]|nr:hypothetical protein [Deltaproteobacteria bacterium]